MRQNPDARSPSEATTTTIQARVTLERALIDVFDTAGLLNAIAASPATLQSSSLHPLAEILRRAHNDAVGAVEMLAEACDMRGEVQP